MAFPNKANLDACLFSNATSVLFLGSLYLIAGQTSSRSDDGSSPQIPLQRPFRYFGQSYNQIYVRKNKFNKIQNPCLFKDILVCYEEPYMFLFQIL